MNRRTFLTAFGVGGPSALAAKESSLTALAPFRTLRRTNPAEPKVFMRDDGRHSAGIDQFEPPLDRPEITRSVDQLVGSGVDTLLFSAGVEGGTVIYDSRVAQKLGDNVDKWTHPVHYRDARHIRQIIANGHDRVKLLCDRCHENGIWFIASLPLDIGSFISARGHGRTSDFVFNNPQFQVGKDADPRARALPVTRFSFLHPEVRKERFLIFEELLSRYETDGVELLTEFPPLCRLWQVGQLAPILTQWIRELRTVAQKAQQTQGRRKRIFVSLPADSESWKSIGYDVAIWVSEKLVDGLICTSSIAETHDQDLKLAASVQLTRNTSCRVLAASHSGLGRQLEGKATQPMVWAAAANAYYQGADGFGLDDPHWFTWPWTREEYETLRLLGQPDMLASANKLYRIVSADKGSAAPETAGTSSPLPCLLSEGNPVTVSLRVADDLESWSALGRIKLVLLRIRLTNLDASLNEVKVELNDRLLPNLILQLNDLTYRIIKGTAVSPFGYIFEYALTPEYYPRQGHNAVRVTLVRKDPNIEVPFEVCDIGCLIDYRLHRNFEQQPIEY